ncbi:hypothetical protein ACFQYP_40730 [Nonomuraea antimicrobica]
MRTVFRLSTGVPVVLTALAALAACGSDTAPATSGSTAPGKVAVAATDTECKVAVTQVTAGTTTFAITNGGSKVTEFYVYAPGDRVMAEVENIVPGLTRSSSPNCPPARTRPRASPAWSARASATRSR